MKIFLAILIISLLCFNKSFSITTYKHLHAKEYFDTQDNGKISGNAANYLYSDMNTVSIFGDLATAGEKRIVTREKTLAKYFDKWSKERRNFFKSRTEKFKQQSKDYKKDLNKPHKYIKGITTIGRPGSGGKIKYKTWKWWNKWKCKNCKSLAFQQ